MDGPETEGPDTRQDMKCPTPDCGQNLIMKFCQVCGRPNTDQDMRCPAAECGQILITKFCAICGSKNPYFPLTGAGPEAFVMVEKMDVDMDTLASDLSNMSMDTGEDTDEVQTPTRHVTKIEVFIPGMSTEKDLSDAAQEPVESLSHTADQLAEKDPKVTALKPPDMTETNASQAHGGVLKNQDPCKLSIEESGNQAEQLRRTRASDGNDEQEDLNEHKPICNDDGKSAQTQTENTVPHESGSSDLMDGQTTKHPTKSNNATDGPIERRQQRPSADGDAAHHESTNAAESHKPHNANEQGSGDYEYDANLNLVENQDHQTERQPEPTQGASNDTKGAKSMLDEACGGSESDKSEDAFPSIQENPSSITKDKKKLKASTSGTKLTKKEKERQKKEHRITKKNNQKSKQNDGARMQTRSTTNAQKDATQNENKNKRKQDDDGPSRTGQGDMGGSQTMQSEPSAPARQTSKVFGMNNGSSVDKDDGKRSGQVAAGPKATYAQTVQKGGSAGENQTSNKSSPSIKNKNVSYNSHIKVMFEAVVSPDFTEEDSYTGQIGIMYYDIHNSKFMRPPSQNMVSVRKVDDNFHIIQLSVSLPLYAVQNTMLTYKYYYMNTKEKVEFEHIPKPGFQESDRYAPIQRRNGDTEFIHQFDGIIHRKQKKSRLVKLKGRLQSFFTGQHPEHVNYLLDTLKGLELMLPAWTGFGHQRNVDDKETTAVYVLFHLIAVMDCVYIRLHAESFQYYEEDVKKVLWNHINSGVKALDTNERNESFPRMAAALLLVHIINVYDLYPVADLTVMLSTRPIYRALLVDCDLNEMKKLDDHFSPQVKKLLRASLLRFIELIRNDKKNNDSYWVMAVPILHFLNNDCQPNEQVSMSTKHTNEDWWGTQGLSGVLRAWKRDNCYWPRKDDKNALLRNLIPLMTVDRLLPRTLMAIITCRNLEVEELNHFTPEAILGNVYVDVKSSNVLPQKIHKWMEVVIKQLQELKSLVDKGEQDPCLQSANMYAKIGLDVLKELAPKAIDQNRHEGFLSVIDVIATAIHLMKLALKNIKATDKVTKELIDGVYSHVSLWLQKMCHSRTTSSYDFQVLTRLLNISYGEDLDDYWKNLVMGSLHDIYGQIDMTGVFTIYCWRLKDCHDLIENYFGDSAFNAIEDICKDDQHSYFPLFGAKSDQDKIPDKAQKLVMKLLMKVWPKDEHDEDKILELVLTWQPFTRLIELFALDPEWKSTGQPPSVLYHPVHYIQKGLKAFTHITDDLLSGDIKLAKLKLLAQPEKVVELKKLQGAVAKFNSADEQVGQDTVKFLELAVESRKKEYAEFRVQERKVKTFKIMCEMAEKVDLSAIDHKLSQDPDGLKISDICSPLDVALDKRSEDYQPVVTFFELDDVVWECLDNLGTYKISHLFRKLWMDHANATERRLSAGTIEKFDVVTVVQEVWKPSVKQFKTVFTKLHDGSITFQDLERHFGSWRDNPEQIENELKDMCKASGLEDRDRIHNRRVQIQQYYQLKQYIKGAKTILQFKEDFHLTGDFSMLDKIGRITQSHSDSVPLEAMSEDLVNAGKLLANIDHKMIECVEMFLTCKDLVDWLKENLDGPRQIQVLVDLAMITASGQGDDEVHKVKCLYDSAIAYAPLIYDLKPEDGFNEFMKHCKQVWEDLKTDPKLPDKLHDTNIHLDWVKRVRESKGSMEVGAFTQAENINSNGIYKVGKIDANGLPKTFEEALELIVPEDGDHKERTYTYQQLNDLQSRLMLVAGKAQEGKEQVDRFVEMFDGVTRLAKLYIKLCAAGSIIFESLVCTCHCSSKQETNLHINFELSESVIHAGRDNVSKHIRNLCETLEDCLKEWLKHIDEKRDCFGALNYFSTEQLVVLRRELAKMCSGNGERMSDAVYMMLHLVYPNCTPAQLKRAIQKVCKDMEDQERYQEKENTTEEPIEPIEEVQNVDTESKEKLRRALLESDYSERLVSKALQKFTADEEQDAVLWCMEQDDEEMSEDDEDHEDQATEPSASDADSWEATTKFLFKTDSPDFERHSFSQSSHFTEDIKNLWHKFLKQVSQSKSECLSTEHLGLILDCLEFKDAVDRPMQVFLNADKASLIVCPQNALLQTVLVLYLDIDGQECPLPQRDEVLLCAPDTSAEQVELFLRRAAFDQRRRLFCLADVGQLDYDVARKAEEYFDKYCKHREGIRLVVVCSQQTEDHAHVVTFLEQYRVTFNAALYQREHIQRYLQHRFTTDMMDSAAVVDPESCTVRLVKSHRAGMGKTLWVRRLREKLERGRRLGRGRCVTIPLHRERVHTNDIVRELYKYVPDPHFPIHRIFHIDLAHEVQEGVDHFLFNLLVLGSVTDKEGKIWQRSENDLYVVESMPLLQKAERGGGQAVTTVHSILTLLPCVTCWSPAECLLIYEQRTIDMKTRYPDFAQSDHDQLMDEGQYRSETFQRPYQYLYKYSRGHKLHNVDVDKIRGNVVDCLRILMRYCGLVEPSWAEISHFVHFLNVQLTDCEESHFCQPFVEPDLPGFRNFVVKFMINMSRDFATRSLNISEETPDIQRDFVEREDAKTEGDLVQYIIKRRWETSPHPYVFFNSETGSGQRHSMTFLGFYINRNGDILDPNTNEILEQQVMPRNLQQALQANRVQLNENFENLRREQKIERLAQTMGIQFPHDPDQTYELTTDNIKKILAIHMRFRCEIPVVVMGETGCGKTRLVKFMCDLQKPPGADIDNLVLMKVHGGTTEEDIIAKVQKAGALAEQNREEFSGVDTVLFFDEANTTDAIGLIKEILCDGTMRGQPLPAYIGLKFVVACNPYRKHSEDVIKKLEQAGLGYHVQADDTKDRLGRIPMRQLVYRVHALPQSMLPLVWDFGQLNARIEELYIRQMVTRYILDDRLPDEFGLREAISAVLSASQEFMKQQQNECSFVSLRDVDRVLQVMSWFYGHRDLLFPLMDSSVNQTDNQDLVEVDEDEEEDAYSDEESEQETVDEELSDSTRALVLALGVCYQACLEDRQGYRDHVINAFRRPLVLPQGTDTIDQEISRCQEVFLEKIVMPANIARNQALKENLFMMVVCIELRIPLFLVGKPGSSKSLAKTIVAETMQRDTARHELFKAMKQVHMISFQCSPLSTADGIIGTFQQCAQLQKDRHLEQNVSVVVLDEVGLAEDSPLMPLKTLHPLLEDGCAGEEEPAPHKKVACIAISNWALDPAKMNRGIHVKRAEPGIQELCDTALGICDSVEQVQYIKPLVRPLAEGYRELYHRAEKEKREYFGLRDYYSLIKMICCFTNKQQPSWIQLKHAILRNFGGLDNVNPVDVFEKHLTSHIDKDADPTPEDPDCAPSSLIKMGIRPENETNESRYLLILTENYAALGILQQDLLDHRDTKVIFGSSFPKDQEYTQVCRNINKIKVCMEAGRTVVLLNLENLYESLYDALNQYYMYLGGAKFVDIGLGTQRLKCEVHKKFRLVVVAEKEVVYNKFPIPLINRLEKHFLTMSNMLSADQAAVVRGLKEWAGRFANIRQDIRPHMHRAEEAMKLEDVFVGYHADTIPSMVMKVCEMTGRKDGGNEWKAMVTERCQSMLLQCATPDAVARLSMSSFSQDEATALSQHYFHRQKHSTLGELLREEICGREHDQGLFLQVSTSSRLLSTSDATKIAKSLKISKKYSTLAALHAYSTEHQFVRMLREFFARPSDEPRLLFLQYDSSSPRSGDLIACARYLLQDEYRRGDAPTHVVLIIQLPRVGRGNFVGFQGGRWVSYYIDELHIRDPVLPSFDLMQNCSVSQLYSKAECLKRHEDEISSQLPEPQQQMDTAAIGFLLEETNPETEDMERAIDDQKKDLQDRSPSQQEKLSKQLVPEDPGHVLNIDRVVIKCIHGAAALIKDQDIDADRKTQRVTLLLKLCERAGPDSGRGPPSFLDTLHVRISQLLQEKEEEFIGTTRACDWLCREAASFKMVYKAGTFRKSMEQYIECRVTPLLAGLIAVADKNRNLDILAQNQDSWISQMWLAMLANPDIVKLQYNELQTIHEHRVGRELSEFQVESSGCERTLFSAVLPFSWTLYNQINALMYQARTEQVRKDHEEFVSGVLQTIPLGKALEQAAQQVSAEALTNMYLQDYVRMVYKPHNSQLQQEEYQIVMDTIRKAALEIFLSKHTIGDEVSDAPQFSLTIPGIHQTYSVIQRRLHLCSQAFQVWPEGVSRILNALEEHPEDQDLCQLINADREMTLDLVLLTLLLQELEPDKGNFDKEERRCRTQWMLRVDSLRPVIERILDSVDNSGLGGTVYGQGCRTQHGRCRSQWTRIHVVYLFLKHVCHPESQAKTVKGKPAMYKCLPLWNLLKDPDLKQEQALDSLAKFLNCCNKLACSYYIAKDLCVHCQTVLSNPAKLPCGKHLACLHCVQELIALKTKACPKCKKAFPEDYTPSTIPEKKEEILAHNQYKRRCNAFFMDVVSQLCFHGSTPPNLGVITRLMGYVTCEYSRADLGTAPKMTTKMLGIYKDSIDPTPTVRSFLLQLMLRANIEEVRDHMEEYFSRTRDLMADGPPQQILELCVLCVHCLEDHFHNQAAQCPDPHSRTAYIQDLLERPVPPDAGLDIYTLEAVACVRVCMSEVAGVIHAVYVDDPGQRVPREVQRLLNTARQICAQTGNVEISLFLMRQIGRRYGRATLKRLAEELEWVVPEYLRGDDGTSPDCFAILGKDYTDIRELLGKIVLGNDVEDDDDLDIPENQECKEIVKERNSLLSVYREVTKHYAENDNGQVFKQAQDTIEDLFTNNKPLEHQEFVKKLLTNELAEHCDGLTVTPNQDAVHAEIQDLLVHFWIVLELVEQGKCLQPLVLLWSDPESMAAAFLPTMPEDHLEEVRAAVLAASQTIPDETPVMFQCPNGHPYVIGDCGRPVEDDICKACGAVIGGSYYNVLHAGNSLIPIDQNRTSPGHILGAADQRSTVAVPERLSPAATSTLRLLVHMAMYLGANHDPQAVSALIRSPAGLPPPDTATFLWRHLVRDVEVLGRAVGRSLEDCAVLVHSLLGKICDTGVGGLQGVSPYLQTTDQRKQWEENFAEQYITPVIMNKERLLEEAHRVLVNDERQGNNPLLRALYEVDTPTGPTASDEVAPAAAATDEAAAISILQEPCVWRFHTRITIEHLSQQFQEVSARAQRQSTKAGGARAKNVPKKMCPVLELFLRKHHDLQTLRFLPGIMKLLGRLSQMFHRKIDRVEADKLTLRKFKKQYIQEHLVDEFDALLKNFAEAWELLRGKLSKFAVGGSVVPAQNCDRDITDSTSLALLLPAPRGHGLCATALVHFLVDTHNSFMEEYATIRGISLPSSEATSSREVTLAHLVAFDPQRDLAPVLLAHCHYELTLGGATAQSTDFEGLEKAVEERFVRGRARVTAEVPIILFQEENTNAAVFKKLESKIPQERELPAAVHTQVIADHGRLTDLNHSLATLDITLGFLVAVGGPRDTPLSDFVQGTLRMSAGALGRGGAGAAHRCQLRHVRALWLTLATERAKLLTYWDRDAFDSLPAAYKQPLTEAQEDHVSQRLRHSPHLEGFVSALYECVVLQLAASTDDDDGGTTDLSKYKFVEVLEAFLQTRDLPADCLQGVFPDDVLVAHSTEVWKLAQQILAQRE